MARKIVVTSGKGGVGKTTVVSALGWAFAKHGQKTLLIDMDFGLNNLDVLMGVENKIVYDIIDVLEGKCSPKQAIIQDFFEENLYIFPSTHSFCSVRFGAKELFAIITSVEKYFDIILIDCPAGMDGGFRRAIGCGDEFVIVTTPHLSAIRDASKVISVLPKTPYLIINRVRGDLILENQSLSVENISNALSGNLIGVLPEDDCVAKQTMTSGELDSNSQIMQSINMCVECLLGGNKILYDPTKKYKGFWGSIKRSLKKKI